MKVFALGALMFICLAALAASSYSYFAWRKVAAAHEAGSVAVDAQALTMAFARLQGLSKTEIILWLIALTLTGIVAWLEWRSKRASL